MTGAAPEDERKELREIVAKINDLFAGEVTEADFICAVTTWKGHLMASEALAEQAKNNSVEQFSMGDFKDAFMDVVIDAKDAQNSIADQLLKDERVFGVMQRMLAKMPPKCSRAARRGLPSGQGGARMGAPVVGKSVGDTLVSACTPLPTAQTTNQLGGGAAGTVYSSSV